MSQNSFHRGLMNEKHHSSGCFWEGLLLVWLILLLLSGMKTPNLVIYLFLFTCLEIIFSDLDSNITFLLSLQSFTVLLPGPLFVMLWSVPFRKSAKNLFFFHRKKMGEEDCCRVRRVRVWLVPPPGPSCSKKCWNVRHLPCYQTTPIKVNIAIPFHFSNKNKQHQLLFNFGPRTDLCCARLFLWSIKVWKF